MADELTERETRMLHAAAMSIMDQLNTAASMAGRIFYALGGTAAGGRLHELERVILALRDGPEMRAVQDHGIQSWMKTGMPGAGGRPDC